MGGFVKDTLYHEKKCNQPQAGDTTAPAAPAGLTVTAANDVIVSLNWNNNTESDLYGYDIYRSTTSGSGYVKINLVRSENSKLYRHKHCHQHDLLLCH